jgi:hypothetical protein
MAAPAYRSEPAVAAALLSAGAAAIHASAAGPHFAEHLLLGVLFVVTAIAQAAWAALVLTAPSSRLLAAGAFGNLGVAAVWAVSRTVGLPFLPGAEVPEPLGALDLAATSFEVVVVAACVLLLAAGGPYHPVSGRAMKRFATVGAIAIAALTSAAYAGMPNGGHHHDGLSATEDEHAVAHHAAPAPAFVPSRPRPAKRKPEPRATRHATSNAHAHAYANGVAHSH